VQQPPAMQRVSSWGMVQSCAAYVRMPRSADDVRAAISEARARGLTVGLRGTGNSYGDAALNGGGLLLDMSSMNRILEWDPASGRISVEPGVTIADIWKHVVGDGYWPPVVPGTMRVSIGGAASMNIHGKNNFQASTIGAHIESFDMLLADGRVETCTREQNAELFHAAIGGFGVLGCFLRVTLKLKKLESGLLRVEPLVVTSFAQTIERFESLRSSSDYLVGWHDAFGSGDRLGRGLLHRATYVRGADDAQPSESLKLERQTLPMAFFGVIPKSWLWTGLWFFMNDFGMRLVNFAKYAGGRSHERRGAYTQPHAAYHFLLDYVPNWKFAYKPGGLIQYQVFVPKEHAARVFGRLVQLARAHRHPPYLLVTKRHQPDPFWMTHAVDGFSMAMDFRIKPGKLDRFRTMAYAMDEIVLDAGGRFYFAKDSVMRPEVLRRSYPEDNVRRFLELKRQLDPDALFQTDLYRRVFG
jgi:decaprenylphospho-beta-D-ribofuranose 2-oxidase